MFNVRKGTLMNTMVCGGSRQPIPIHPLPSTSRPINRVECKAMSEDQSNPPPGMLPEAENTPGTNFLAGKMGGMLGKIESYNEINGLPVRRGPPIKSSSEEAGKLKTGKLKPRKTLSDYEAAGQANRQQVHADIKSGADLPKLYSVSHDHFWSMRNRAKDEGNPMHPRWMGRNGFANFLTDIGPIPQIDRSLDRIDCRDKEYGPGKVRWASPREQANNRKNTKRIYDPTTKAREALTIAAENNGITPKRVRSRLERGADPDQVINEILMDDMKAATHPVSGKRELIPGNEQASNVVALRAEAPPPPRPVLIKDPEKRLPWVLDDARLERWVLLHEQSQCYYPHGKDWPFEFALRHAYDEQRAANKLLLNLVDQYGDDPDRMTAEERNEMRKAEEFVDHWDARVRDAEAALPDWIKDMGFRERKHAPVNKLEMIAEHGADFLRIRNPYVGRR